MGSEAAYVEDRTEFMATAGKGYNVVANPTGSKPLAAWLTGKPFADKIDKAHAVLIAVDVDGARVQQSGRRDLGREPDCRRLGVVLRRLAVKACGRPSPRQADR